MKTLGTRRQRVTCRHTAVTWSSCLSAKIHSLVEKSLRTSQLSTVVLTSLPITQWNILEKYEKIDKCISAKKRQVAMSIINRNPRLADRVKIINYLIL